MAPDVRSQSGNLIRSILTFLLIATLGAGHYLITLFLSESIFLAAILPIQALILYSTIRAYKRTPWNRITL